MPMQVFRTAVFQTSYVFKVTPGISIFTVKNAPRRLDAVLKNCGVFIKFC